MAWGGFQKRGHKYGAKRVEIDGIKFPSNKQAARYLALKQMEGVGLIQNLQLEVTFKLEVNGQLVCRYRADFVYQETVCGQSKTVVEDVKGFKTDVYELKKKLMKACLGIEISEV